MPIYEYLCKQCDKKFEELVFNAELPICPYCGSQNTQKIMSCCARHTKGTGGEEYTAPSGGGGCAGCSGGNCASCGH